MTNSEKVASHLLNLSQEEIEELKSIVGDGFQFKVLENSNSYQQCLKNHIGQCGSCADPSGAWTGCS